VIDLRPACGRMIELLAGVADDHLARPTPCTDYTVGELINHVDDVSRVFAPLAPNGTGARPDADAGNLAGGSGPGWREVVAGHVRELGAAWDDPVVWRGSTELSGLELPNERWGKIALTELVVHGWDLANATGQPCDLPERTLRACLDHVTRFVPNAPFPGLWGPPVDVAEDAALLDRIVAITGRAPWRADAIIGS
jgi:uncharacterized protein (TIGR03086 family)